MAVFISKTWGYLTPTAIATRRNFIYDQAMHLIGESSLTSAFEPGVAYEHLWLGDRPVAEEDLGGQTYWTVTDHLGTPFMETFGTRTTAWRIESEPYGWVYSLRSGSDRHQPLRFPGQEAEQLNQGNNGATEKRYNIFRWYHPKWGRYSQGDPLRNPFAAKSSVFSYTADNPTRFRDLLGLDCGPCCNTPGDFAADKGRILASVNHDLFVYLASHFYVPQTYCGTFADVVEGGINRAKPQCHDAAPVFSAEKTPIAPSWPAHAAMAIKPCNTNSWQDGVILDPWPSGVLGEYPWDMWRPGLRRYTPTITYPNLIHPAKCE
jgi:RHS repeat-associated protein